LTTQRPAWLNLAFPDIDAPTLATWRSFRAANSPAAKVAVDLHFTLAFACSAVPEADYLAHVSAVAKACAVVPFCLKYAMLGADDEDERAYVFLVPDEGFAGISRLHDRLYTGPLQNHLRLDLPYVPHITVGVTTDRARAKALCDALNAQGVLVHGTIRALTVGAVVAGAFQTRAVLPLVPLHGVLA
jgi:2'-5' RNA ligase